MQESNLKRFQGCLKFAKFFRDRFDAVFTGILDAGINDIDLAPGAQLLADEVQNLGQLAGSADECFEAATSRRNGVYHRNVELAIEREAKSSRNGSRRHHQQMRIVAFLDQLFALRDAEPVLFVND